jgi:putative transposase
MGPRTSVRERRHRLPPAAYQGPVTVSVTGCLQGRRPVFEEPRVVAPLVSLLHATADKNSCAVVAFCFMPDHVHVVLRGFSFSSDTRRSFAAFKQASGFWLARNRPGSTWQKDFYDRVLRTEADVIREVWYIVANPLRVELVEAWREYPWAGSFVINLEDLLSAEGSAG